MDPQFLHRPVTTDEKPQLPTQSGEYLDDVFADGDSDNDDSLDEDAPQPLPDDDSSEMKRPRLRLAHACDRCRKRKIRCDTQQPCGPCQATHNQCTFHTPSRRTSRPKAAGINGHGMKRPHSPSSAQSTVEIRLAALEAMLRDVPPNVHNAFLSSLDARLGSGTGVGINEGMGSGALVAPEALSGLNGVGAGGASSWLESLTGALASGSDWSAPTKRLSRRDNESVDQMAKRMEGMSFFYEDEIGQAKWQGATSGFPLLDLLTAATASDGDGDSGQPSRQLVTPSEAGYLPAPNVSSSTDNVAGPSPSVSSAHGQNGVALQPGSPSKQKRTRFFPDRTPRPHQTLNPEASWKVITGVIPPDLMDTLVRCYLSTSHLLWPFLHVPSFLADYANPQQWGEPGFACFIVAVCTLSSRHVDDPRVRSNPSDPSTAGKQYFELFKRLRDLPSADRPTLYSIQAAFLAAVFAFGLGNLSKAFALQAESITLCLDGGLHRSVDAYDHFDAVEKETRKVSSANLVPQAQMQRTFWAIYSWDKQSAGASYGHRLRDSSDDQLSSVGHPSFISATATLRNPSSWTTRT